MSKLRIAVFWGKPVGPMRGRYACPFANIGPKYPVYESLFNLLSEKAEVYAAVGYENYTAPMTFSESYRYLGAGKFEKVNTPIEMDAIYDRSAKMIYPGPTKAESENITNSSNFKLFSNNKWEFYQRFSEYCPTTVFAEDEKQYHKILSDLDPGKTYVVKPFNGYKGKGIEFGRPHELESYQLEKPVVIQEFKETKGGVPGIVKGRHDLRVAIINGEIVWATIRQPKGEGLMANVAQGGSIMEIDPKTIPESVLPIVRDLAKDFKKNFYNPLFAVDFGFENGKPFIYEINDQIGFPRPEMQNNTLVKSLVELLLAKARS